MDIQMMEDSRLNDVTISSLVSAKRRKKMPFGDINNRLDCSFNISFPSSVASNNSELDKENVTPIVPRTVFGKNEILSATNTRVTRLKSLSLNSKINENSQSLDLTNVSTNDSIVSSITSTTGSRRKKSLFVKNLPSDSLNMSGVSSINTTKSTDTSLKRKRIFKNRTTESFDCTIHENSQLSTDLEENQSLSKRKKLFKSGKSDSLNLDFDQGLNDSNTSCTRNQSGIEPEAGYVSMTIPETHLKTLEMCESNIQVSLNNAEVSQVRHYNFYDQPMAVSLQIPAVQVNAPCNDFPTLYKNDIFIESTEELNRISIWPKTNSITTSKLNNCSISSEDTTELEENEKTNSELLNIGSNENPDSSDLSIVKKKNVFGNRSKNASLNLSSMSSLKENTNSSEVSIVKKQNVFGNRSKNVSLNMTAISSPMENPNLSEVSVKKKNLFGKRLERGSLNVLSMSSIIEKPNSSDVSVKKKNIFGNCSKGEYLNISPMSSMNENQNSTDSFIKKKGVFGGHLQGETVNMSSMSSINQNSTDLSIFKKKVVFGNCSEGDGLNISPIFFLNKNAVSDMNLEPLTDSVHKNIFSQDQTEPNSLHLTAMSSIEQIPTITSEHTLEKTASSSDSKSTQNSSKSSLDSSKSSSISSKSSPNSSKSSPNSSKSSPNSSKSSSISSKSSPNTSKSSPNTSKSSPNSSKSSSSSSLTNDEHENTDYYNSSPSVIRNTLLHVNSLIKENNKTINDHEPYNGCDTIIHFENTEQNSDFNSILKELQNRAKISLKKIKEEAKNEVETEKLRLISLYSPKKILKPKKQKSLKKIVEDDDLNEFVKKRKLKKFISQQLYNYLVSKLKPLHGFNGAIKANEISDVISKCVWTVLKKSQYQGETINELKIELAKYKIIDNTFDFYNFIRKFLPYEFELKAIPCVQPISNVVWPPKDYTRKEFEPIVN